MSFRDEIRVVTQQVEVATRATFFRVAEEVERSIVEGSEISTAPGQPVDTGYLKSSWYQAPEGPTTILIATNTAYARVIEEGTRAAYDPEGTPRPAGLPSRNVTVGPRGGTRVIRSTVGGHHSVRLTRLAWQQLVDHAVAHVQAGT